jgi:hypothetical protein
MTRFILEKGLSGFGRPPVRLRMDVSASDGGVFRFSRRNMRDIDMPITVTGASREDVEFNLRRLQRVLDNSSGVGTVVTVTSPEGDSWSVTGFYVQGANTVWGEGGDSDACALGCDVALPGPVLGVVEGRQLHNCLSFYLGAWLVQPVDDGEHEDYVLASAGHGEH